MTMKRGRGQRAEQPYHHGNLREAAVNAALDALTRKMPTEISLRDLAKAIGVGHSSLYAHFRDRDELFATVSEQGFEALRAEMQAASEKPGDKVAQLSAAYLRFARANPAHYRVMYGPANMATPVGGRIEEACSGCLRMLVDAIGEITNVPEEEAHRRAIGVWCALHGLVSLTDRFGPLRNEVSDVAEQEMAYAFGHALAAHA